MTVGDWLAARTPRPPESLATRVTAALGEHAKMDQIHASAVCLSVAESMLAELLGRSSADANANRDTGLDLLTIDALVTYAFEAAAADPETLGKRADAAMRTLSRLAAPSERPRETSESGAGSSPPIPTAT